MWIGLTIRNKSLDCKIKSTVVVVSTGGIAKISDISQFLFGMFTDKRIMPLNKIARFLLAAIITSLRARQTYKIFKQVQSPVKIYAASIADKLQKQLDMDIFFALNYTKPKISKLIKRLKSYDKIFVVSLYPQFSYTTTASELDVFRNLKAEIIPLNTFYKDNRYLDIIQSYISNALLRIPEPQRNDTILLFSAHSLPIKLYESTHDPYISQVKETAALVAKRFNNHKYRISFQSKLGPVKWISPTTFETIAELPKNVPVLIVPISFIIDNTETLYEIDILYKKFAEGLGMHDFIRSECINDDDRFVSLIKNIILERLYDK